jgi:GNAT superfamily N-acetyltransferase
MELVPLEADDPEEFDRFFGVFDRQQRAEREFPSLCALEEARVLFTRPNRYHEWRGLLAIDDGEVMGAAWLDWPLLENTEILSAQIVVEPGHRRRAVGSRIVDAVLAMARELGRRSVLAELATPHRGAQTTPGVAFAGHHGFVRKHTELHLVLQTPVTHTALATLAAEAAPHHHGYRLMQLGEECPPEWVDQFCALLSLMGDETPTGDLELDAATYTPERLRDAESRRRQSGLFTGTNVAVAPDGSLAGYTLMAGSHNRAEIFQLDTLVRPEHRGRRLGLAMKVANLRWLQARHDASIVHTWNAEVNAPMLAVNQAMGFRPVEYLGEWQREV